MSVIDEIKSRLDIVDIISETVNLRHSGKNYTGFCPFHPNTKTPAFAVFPDSQSWRCFGQCNEGGDIFGFVMKREGWDFSETLRYLADRAGVTLQEFTPEQQEQEEENDILREVLSMAVTFFQHQLLHTEAGKSALDYLYSRSLNDETIDAFALGYAPDSWDALTNYMTSRHISHEHLVSSGLASKREDGGVYDRFRHRLIIPIRDHQGRMAGFGGRILRPDDVPKYLNSPKTPVFDKGRLLYGLDMARREIRIQDRVVIVEGYLDVIGPYQAGFKNCVSAMGTALTEDQFRLIKRYSRQVILALDADTAGQQATLRGLQTARQTMEREGEFVFDARGLMQVEGRLKADIRVTTLPDGLDPDEIVIENPDLWAELIEHAKPIVTHVMDTLATREDFDDPKTKEEIAEQVLPLIEDVPGSVEREAYRQQLARLLKVDERALIRRSAGQKYRPRKRRSAPQPDGYRPPAVLAPHSHRQLEESCVTALLVDPSLLLYIDRAFREFELACMHPEDFLHSDHRQIFTLVREALEQEVLEPITYIQEHTPEGLFENFIEVRDPEPYPDWRLQPKDPQLESLLHMFIRLRRFRIDEGLDQLVFLQSLDDKESDETMIDINRTAVDYLQARVRIDRALRSSLAKGKYKS